MLYGTKNGMNRPLLCYYNITKRRTLKAVVIFQTPVLGLSVEMKPSPAARTGLQHAPGAPYDVLTPLTDRRATILDHRTPLSKSLL